MWNKALLYLTSVFSYNLDFTSGARRPCKILNFIYDISQQAGLVDNLHVSQLRKRFCLFFGGAKTLDDGLPFMKCTLTLFKRDLFITRRPLLHIVFIDKWEFKEKEFLFIFTLLSPFEKGASYNSFDKSNRIAIVYK